MRQHRTKDIFLGAYAFLVRIKEKASVTRDEERVRKWDKIEKGIILGA